MAKIINKEKCLDFNDISIVPSWSDVEREEADVSSVIRHENFNEVKYKLPIIVSPMDTVSSKEMSLATLKIGFPTAIHRYQPLESIIEQWRIQPLSPVAIGSYQSHESTINKLIGYGVNFFIVDVAHGGSRKAIDTIYKLKSINKKIKVMSGSVCTHKDALACVVAGADLLRVGVSPGSSCETRSLIGIGLPLPQSLIDIAPIKKDFPNIQIVGDGGIDNSGNFVKAIALGADFTMIGTLFGRCKEGPSKLYVETMFWGGPQVIELNKENMDFYKSYEKRKKVRGMASLSALTEGNGKEVYNAVVEGKEAYLPYIGPISDVVKQFELALKQAMFYVGARNIKEFQEKAEIRVI